jgi:hypothetical protein
VSDVTPDHAPDYPPQPWDLAGTGHLSTWRVPVTSLPQLPVGVRPVAVRGTAVVATAFVDYSSSGLMAYHELLAAVVVRHGRGVALSITDIWVDSPTSMRGGRGLWGIPKDLASFAGLAASLPGSPGRPAGGPPEAIASASFTPGRLPSLRLPALPSSVVQTLGGRTVASPIRASGRVRTARSSWTFDPAGRLAWLASARPVTSVVAEGFRMRFGA